MPENEIERLQSLLKMYILDTEEEEFYDNLTKIAASIMNAPVALISLVDKERQWFKSKQGINVQETAREHSFCTHAIMEPDKPLIIPDATKDPRFSGNPLVVADPKIRFYYGAPLVTENNEAIGTICTLDSVAREAPSQHQIDGMKCLSSVIMYHLSLRTRFVEIDNNVQKLEVLKNISLPENADFNLSRVYQDLNSECDAVLAKIKLRREKKKA